MLFMNLNIPAPPLLPEHWTVCTSFAIQRPIFDVPIDLTQSCKYKSLCTCGAHNGNDGATKFETAKIQPSLFV